MFLLIPSLYRDVEYAQGVIMPKQSQKIGKIKDDTADELEETDLSSLLASVNDSRIRGLVKEYWELNLKAGCTDADDDRLEEILVEAEEDSLLNFWFLEINHILGHKQRCLNEECRKSYDESKVILLQELELLKQNLDSEKCCDVEQGLRQYLSSRAIALSRSSRNSESVGGKR